MVLVPEPVAAGHDGAPSSPDGTKVAVFDLGGGTFDAVVLRRARSTWTVVGRPGGLDPAGGETFDSMLHRHLIGEVARVDEQAAPALDAPGSAAERGLARTWWRDVRTVKEDLSERSSCHIAVPGTEHSVLVTRDQLELLVHDEVARSVEVFATTIADATNGTEPTVILVCGDASRMPIVDRLLRERFNSTPISAVSDPKGVVARGAVAAATAGTTVPTEPASLDEPVPVPRRRNGRWNRSQWSSRPPLVGSRPDPAIVPDQPVPDQPVPSPRRQLRSTRAATPAAGRTGWSRAGAGKAPDEADRRHRCRPGRRGHCGRGIAIAVSSSSSGTDPSSTTTTETTSVDDITSTFGITAPCEPTTDGAMSCTFDDVPGGHSVDATITPYDSQSVADGAFAEEVTAAGSDAFTDEYDGTPDDTTTSFVDGELMTIHDSTGSRVVATTSKGPYVIELSGENFSAVELVLFDLVTDGAPDVTAYFGSTFGTTGYAGCWPNIDWLTVIDGALPNFDCFSTTLGGATDEIGAAMYRVEGSASTHIADTAAAASAPDSLFTVAVNTTWKDQSQTERGPYVLLESEDPDEWTYTILWADDGDPSAVGVMYGEDLAELEQFWSDNSAAA